MRKRYREIPLKSRLWRKIISERLFYKIYGVRYCFIEKRRRQLICLSKKKIRKQKSPSPCKKAIGLEVDTRESALILPES
jgi:hypothetical protein